MKPYPSVVHAYTNKLRPVIGLFEPNDSDEACDRIPPFCDTRPFRARPDPRAPEPIKQTPHHLQGTLISSVLIFQIAELTHVSSASGLKKH